MFFLCNTNSTLDNLVEISEITVKKSNFWKFNKKHHLDVFVKNTVRKQNKHPVLTKPSFPFSSASCKTGSKGAATWPVNELPRWNDDQLSGNWKQDSVIHWDVEVVVFHQPIWNICSSNWIISPGIGVNIKNVWGFTTCLGCWVAPPRFQQDLYPNPGY